MVIGTALAAPLSAFQVWVNFNDQVGQFADGSTWPVMAKEADAIFGPGRAVLKWTDASLLKTVYSHAPKKSLVIETELKHIVQSEAFRVELEKADTAAPGMLAGIMPYREPEPKGVGSSKWGGGTLITPEDLKVIRGRSWVGPKIGVWGLIRQFDLGRGLGADGRAFIKNELAGFVYEFGVPSAADKYDDVAAAARWAIKNRVPLVLITPPKHFDRSGNEKFLEAYQAFFLGLKNNGVDLASEFLIFMPSGYTHKIKGVDFTPEGVGENYPNTVMGVARWLVDERIRLGLKKSE